jgi:hypothetical protein
VADKNEELLKRIRERYRYGMEKWRRNREEGQKNIRYVSGDPWDDEDKHARQGRPTVCADELNQYVNQVVNTARMSPRGIKIDPAGDQATEQLAEYRENRIRAIEYACNASQAYLNGLQAAVERNLGYWRVTRAYIADSDEQEILVLPVMNPDAILIDPDFKELDGSDIRWAFELDRIPMDVFEDEYPNAEKRSFSAEDFGDDSSYWFDGKNILVASYWEIQTVSKKVGKKGRTTASRTVRQYITNGVEILKEAEQQPGPYIPIVPVFGKELWVDYGGGAERVLLSLVSLARDPQKALAYVMSSMLENVGQLPKTSFIGWKGQFETDADAWATMNQVFHPYLQLDPGSALDGDGNPMEPLGWAKSTPDFGAYSVGADLCRRAIMSAMGISALPTAAQRQNQKSGIALQNIQSQQSVGSYHLIDSYDRAIKLTGRIINGWIAETDLGDTTRPIREADGAHKLVKINTDMPVIENRHEYHFPIADDKGRYQVTVSTGVATESQRSEASDFADTLIQNLKGLPVAPPQAAQILALVIRLKQLGPLGDQMADIISPQQQGQQQQMQQMQQQGAQMQQQMAEMQQALQKLMMERQGKVVEGQFRMQQTQLDAAANLKKTEMQEATKLAVAQINASKDANESIADREIEQYQILHQSAHELALQNDQQAHEAGMQQQDQAHAQQMQAAQAQQMQQQQVQQSAGPAQGQQ